MSRLSFVRIDAMWLAVEPMDMRAGADRLIARVVEVFGAAQGKRLGMPSRLLSVGQRGDPKSQSLRSARKSISATNAVGAGRLSQSQFTALMGVSVHTLQALGARPQATQRRRSHIAGNRQNQSEGIASQSK